MEAGGVQAQYQLYSQDPTKQTWRNTNSIGEQVKKRKNSGNNSNAMTNRTNSPITTPKSAQFPKSQNFAMQTPKSATFINKNNSQQNSLKSSSNNNLSKSPPKSDKNITTTQQKNINYNRSTPKPLNLSKATQLQKLGKVPQSAVFPQKTNRNFNLPNPPKTATFPKQFNGFPKDIRQSTLRFPTTPSSATSNSQHAYAMMYHEQYLYVLEQARLRYYNSNTTPVGFNTANYSQVELSSGTSLCHPEDSDSQESSPQTPRFLPSENYTGSADVYDSYNLQYYPYEDESLLDDSQKYYYHYYFDQSQEYIPPSTPTGNVHQQQRPNTVTVARDERRKSVFGGPMKVHPDTILPIRQPKGPEMSRNFATRIRRKAVNKIHAATAERRSKSAADRRKSAMF